MTELQTVREHLNELKKRLIKIIIVAATVFFISFALSESLILFFIKYYTLELFSLAPLEFIRTQLVISLYLTIAFTFPFILIQLYLFSKPIIKDITRKKTIKYFMYSVSLAIIGLLFGLFLFTKFSLEFFAALPTEVSAFWGVYSVIAFIAISGFSFAIMTQIILIIPLIVKAELADVETFKKSRGVVIVLALALSAILTSPDPVTQILMSAPMYVCFETGLLISRFQKKKTNETKNNTTTTKTNNLTKPLTPNINDLLKLTKTIQDKKQLIEHYKKINYLYEHKNTEQKKNLYPEILELYNRIKNM